MMCVANSLLFKNDSFTVISRSTDDDFNVHWHIRGEMVMLFPLSNITKVVKDVHIYKEKAMTTFNRDYKEYYHYRCDKKIFDVEFTVIRTSDRPAYEIEECPDFESAEEFELWRELH